MEKHQQPGGEVQKQLPLHQKVYFYLVRCLLNTVLNHIPFIEGIWITYQNHIMEKMLCCHFQYCWHPWSAHLSLINAVLGIYCKHMLAPGHAATWYLGEFKARKEPVCDSCRTSKTDCYSVQPHFPQSTNIKGVKDDYELKLQAKRKIKLYTFQGYEMRWSEIRTSQPFNKLITLCWRNESSKIASYLHLTPNEDF